MALLAWFERHKADWRYWAGLYACLIFLTQFGELRQEIIDWDESTFILMAKIFLDGQIPSTQKYNKNPPYIYL